MTIPRLAFSVCVRNGGSGFLLIGHEPRACEVGSAVVVEVPEEHNVERHIERLVEESNDALSR